MSRVLALVNLVLGVSAALAQSVSPLDHLLSYVPDDTALVIVVPGFQKTAAGLTAFGKAVGAKQADELNARKLLEELELLDTVEGLDLTGPLLVAHAPGRSMPLILCTLSDPSAWRAAAHAEEATGGLLRVFVFGESGFAAVKERTLILGEARQDVEDALRAGGKFAERFRAATGGLRPGHDIVLYANRSPWQPMIEMALGAAGAFMRAGAAMSGPQDESMTQLWGWLFGELGKFVREMEVWSAGVRVDGRGVFLETAVTFRAGGPVTDYLKKVSKSNRPLLRGLPAEESILVAACEWDLPPGTGSLSAQCYQALLSTDALKQRLAPEVFEKGLKASIRMNDLMTGYSMSLSRAPIGGMLITGVYFTDDANGILENMRCAYQCSSEFMNPFGAGSSMDMTERTERFGAADIHAFDMVFKMEDEQARRMIETFYGKTTTVYSAPRPKDLLFVMGPTEAARDRMNQLLAAPGPPLLDQTRVTTAGRELSPDPQFYLLLDLPKLFDFMLDAARSAGAPVPALKFAGDPLPLIAFATYLEPERIRAELHVPAEPVKAVVERCRAIGENEDKD